jgi:TetR/AcrR family transcriptional regulator
MALENTLKNSPAGADVTPDLILKAAARAFADNGFNGATFREIGDAAGINFQSIRYHYGSKEKLWEAVVEKLSMDAQEAGLHHEQVISGLPAKQQLRAQIHALVAYQVANPELNRILMREAMKNSKRYRQVYKLYVSRFYDLMKNFFQRMQKEGVVKKDVLLDDLVFATHGALNYRITAPIDSEYYTGKSITSPEVIEQHTDAITKLLLAD